MCRQRPNHGGRGADDRGLQPVSGVDAAGRDRLDAGMIVLMAVFLSGQRRGANRKAYGVRHIVIMMVAVLCRPIMRGQPVIMVATIVLPVVLPEMMRFRPMRVRHPVRHRQAGRRETGDERQQEHGPSGPDGAGSGHDGNVYEGPGAPHEADGRQRAIGLSAAGETQTPPSSGLSCQDGRPRRRR